MPQRSTFSRNILALEIEISLATSRPLFFNCSPKAVVLPPGAAQRSKTFSPGLTVLIAAGNMAAGS